MAEVDFTDLIASSRPRRRLTKIGTFILIGFILLIWSLLISPETEQGQLIRMLLSLVILVGLGISVIRSVTRRKVLAKCSQQVSDLCLQEKWSQAIEPLRRLLGKPVALAQIRYQGLLELAGVAEHTGQLKGATEIYEAIAREQPHGLLGSLALVGKAIVLLKLDQLADADTIIRRLEVSVESRSLKSLVLLGRLYQQIKTGHYSDALTESSNKCELARTGMSSKAAYVYALLGLAYRHQEMSASSDESPGNSPEAGGSNAEVLWQQATMLLGPDILVEKFPELAELEESYPSAPPLPGTTEG